MNDPSERSAAPFSLNAATRGALGPYAGEVEAALATAATPSVFDWDAAYVSTSAMAQALADLPGEGNVADRLNALYTLVTSAAQTASPQMNAAALRAVDDAVGISFHEHVPAGSMRAPHALLDVFVLWPAVFGRHANPLAAMAPMVSMGVFPSVEDGQMYVYHGQLVRPVELPQRTPRPPVLSVVRSLDLE